MEKKEVSFTRGSIPKAMLFFSGPFMLGMFVQNLYGAVDLFVVGHFAATADISAVTIGSQLMTIVTQLIIGFATGVTILIGQYCGAGDKKGLTRTTGTSVVLFSVLAVILAAIYIIFHGLMVTVMQTPPEAMQATREYLFVCAIGIIFIVGYNVINSILTGMGDSRTPFLFVLVACFINIILDVILVKYFFLGALGAAIATTVAQAGSFVFALAYLRKKGMGFPLDRSDIKFIKRDAGRIAKIGAPVAVQNILVGMSFLFITAIINQMGLIASAAVGVVEKLITFLFVPATALGTSVGAASAQNLGAQNYRRAKQCMWYGIGMALVPGVLITIFCQFGGELLTGIFTGNGEVVVMAGEYLKSYIIDILMVSFVFCMNGYFNSCNRSWFSLVHSLITTFAVRIPLAFFLSRLAGASLFTLGWASPISTLVSLFLCVPFLINMDRKNKQLGMTGDRQPSAQQEV